MAAPPGKLDAALPQLPQAAANCPPHLAINAIRGQWKLRALFVHGAQRYNALLKQIEGISPKKLTRNLRELESA